MGGVRMGIETFGSWEQARELFDTSPRKLKKAVREASLKEAEFLAGQMRKRFDKVRPANARSTKNQKKSSKPLVASGDYRNGIGVTPKGDGFYVGVTRGTREARLAAIHEVGKTIVQVMTEKQRKFLHALYGTRTKGKGGSVSGIIVIHIPARPVIRPTIEIDGKGAPKRFVKNILAALGLEE
jgi:hypothetical protein